MMTDDSKNIQIFMRNFPLPVHKCDDIFHSIKTRCKYNCLYKYYIDQKNDRMDDGKTPLIISCIENNFESINTLLTNHANIEDQDNQGWTALHHASSNALPDIVDYLLCVGKANPNSKDIFGYTPLHLSYCNSVQPVGVSLKYIQVVQHLLNYKADINAENKWGCTPLYVVSLFKNVEGNSKIMNILVENGAILKEKYSKESKLLIEEIMNLKI